MTTRRLKTSEFKENRKLVLIIAILHVGNAILHLGNVTEATLLSRRVPNEGTRSIARESVSYI